MKEQWFVVWVKLYMSHVSVTNNYIHYILNFHVNYSTNSLFVQILIFKFEYLINKSITKKWSCFRVKYAAQNASCRVGYA